MGGVSDRLSSSWLLRLYRFLLLPDVFQGATSSTSRRFSSLANLRVLLGGSWDLVSNLNWGYK